MLTPAFHFNILQQFVGVFVGQTNKLTEELNEHREKPFVDIVPYITTFTLNSICGKVAISKKCRNFMLGFQKLLWAHA